MKLNKKQLTEMIRKVTKRTLAEQEYGHGPHAAGYGQDPSRLGRLFIGIDGTSDNVYSLVKASSPEEAEAAVKKEGTAGWGGTHGGDWYVEVTAADREKGKKRVDRLEAYASLANDDFDTTSAANYKEKAERLSDTLEAMKTFFTSASSVYTDGILFFPYDELHESKTMKLDKKQLTEMVRKVIRKALNERHASYAPDGGKMTPTELSAHLEGERDKKRKNMARRAAKKTTRGMELESGGGTLSAAEKQIRTYEARQEAEQNRKRKIEKSSSRGMEFEGCNAEASIDECGSCTGCDEEEQEKKPSRRRLTDVFVDEGFLGGGEADYSRLDEFTAQYIETALWSSTDESDESGGNPLEDNYSVDNIAEEAIAEMKADCEKFQEMAGEMIDGRESDAGHDFWLTRNGHGAGFWDGDWPEHGDALTAISEKFGETSLYVGDDGAVYSFSG